MKTPDLKVLTMDIETSPTVAYVWGRYDQNIAVNQIKSDWSVLAWSAKWLGDPASKIIYYDQRHAKDLSNDKKILVPLWQLLDEADIVITQNGQKFDSPKLNARFILNGMMPPSPYRHFDTYRLARRIACFTSNSLEYLSGVLCKKYKKLKHRKFPGMKLWTECLAGNMKAWKEMEIYNKHDVLATEELYMKIRAWAPESMPSPFIAEKASVLCKVCGDKGRMQRRGVAVKNKARYQRYQCQSCGGWATGEKVK